MSSDFHPRNLSEVEKPMMIDVKTSYQQQANKWERWERKRILKTLKFMRFKFSFKVKKKVKIQNVNKVSISERKHSFWRLFQDDWFLWTMIYGRLKIVWMTWKLFSTVIDCQILHLNIKMWLISCSFAKYFKENFLNNLSHSSNNKFPVAWVNAAASTSV